MHTVHVSNKYSKVDVQNASAIDRCNNACQKCGFAFALAIYVLENLWCRVIQSVSATCKLVSD